MPVRVITPPEMYVSSKYPTLFLAGGITGAPDWQTEYIKLLGDLPVTVFNPRRNREGRFSDVDHDAQVRWEYLHLRQSDIISFWFPEEAPCMITLYELGFAIAERRGTHTKSLQHQLFVGVAPKYRKCRTVVLQIQLGKPDVVITDNLESLVAEVRRYLLDCARV